MSSITDHRSLMPHDKLTAISSTPTFVSIRTLKQELFANAASVSSSLTAPDIGHAMLIIGDAAYNQLATDTQNAAAVAAGVLPANMPAPFVWQPPNRPPAQPPIAVGDTNRAVDIAKATHDRATADYNAFTTVQSILKQQILDAVPTTFVSSLQHDLTGFLTVSPRTLVVHLETMYGAVTNAHLDANLAALEAAWDPSDSMEDLWTRCTQCEHTALAGYEPISLALKMRLMLKVLTQSGLFRLDIRDWNRRPVAQRTWDEFKQFFAEANRERCANMTAGDYRHLANAVHTRSNATRPTFSDITKRTTTSGGSIDKPILYCWTHGCFPHGNGHTSRDCISKKQGHQADATIFDMMGGNDRIRRKPHERDDYNLLNRNKRGRDRKGRGAQANSAGGTRHAAKLRPWAGLDSKNRLGIVC
jgi:hypothetical protein